MLKTLDDIKRHCCPCKCHAEVVTEADNKAKLVERTRCLNPVTLPTTQGAATRERAKGLLDLRAGSD